MKRGNLELFTKYNRATPITYLIGMPLFFLCLAFSVSLWHAYKTGTVFHAMLWWQANGPSIILCGILTAGFSSLFLAIFSKDFRRAWRKEKTASDVTMMLNEGETRDI